MLAKGWPAAAMLSCLATLIAVVPVRAAEPLCMGQRATSTCTRGGLGGVKCLGTPGADHIVGSPGRDVIIAGDGDDIIDAGEGDDLICGGEGNDTIRSGSGNDRVEGEEGDDSLDGDSGKDLLVGGKGRNICLDGERPRACRGADEEITEKMLAAREAAAVAAEQQREAARADAEALEAIAEARLLSEGPTAAEKKARKAHRLATKEALRREAEERLEEEKLRAADDADAPATAGAITGSCSGARRHCRVFVTSSKYAGDLGGLDGADAKCRAAADAAALGGSWKAWLSCTDCGEGGRAIDAAARLVSAPFMLVDGSIVADSLDMMLNCKEPCLRSAIDTDEKGRKVGEADSVRVWTGTFGSGLGTSRPNCKGWTTAETSEDGEVGMIDKQNEDWTSRSSLTPCSTPSRLYCFEQ